MQNIDMIYKTLVSSGMEKDPLSVYNNKQIEGLYYAGGNLFDTVRQILFLTKNTYNIKMMMFGGKTRYQNIMMDHYNRVMRDDESGILKDAVNLFFHWFELADKNDEKKKNNMKLVASILQKEYNMVRRFFPIQIQKCTTCEKELNLGKQNRCIRCMRVAYCSKECQRKDWGHHKVICKYCFTCKKRLQKAKYCMGCEHIHYCDTTCQKKDWSRHKKECLQ